MANLIDVDFLNNFTEVFMFLFIFAIIYGVFTKIDLFKLGDKGKGLNAIIALAIALMTIVSGSVRAMIGTMVPWFFILLLFFIMMMVATMIFGVSNSDMAKVIADPAAYTWIIIFGVIILLFSLGAGFGDSLLSEQDGAPIDSNVTGQGTAYGEDVSTDTGEYQSNLVLTLFHPKVLGLLLFGIIGLITSIFITKTD